MNKQSNRWHLLTLLAIPLAIGSCAKVQVKVPTANENEVCATKDDCKDGLSCYEGICRKVCQSDGDCSTTQKCTNSVCMMNDTAACVTADNCVSPGPCQTTSGAKCVGGECIYEQAKEGTACSTGDSCLVNETCSADGLCTNGTPKDCSHAVASECIDANTIRVFSGTGSCDKEQGCNYDYKEYPCEDCANNASQCWQCNNDSDCVHTWHECFTGACQDGKCEYTFKSGPCGNRCVEGVNYTNYGKCTEEGCDLKETESCNGYQCSAVLDSSGNSLDCLTDCQNDDSCMETHHCQDGSCIPKLANGEACNPNNNGSDCQGGTCKVPEGETTAICCKGDDCCKGDAQCGNGLGCNRDTFACEPDVSGLADGAECSANNECRSKNCVDGHCCTSTCAQDDFCIENRTTTFSCANDQGICRTATIECGNFGCNAEKTGCNTSCSSNDDCIAGFFCNSDSQCEKKHSQGQTCGTIKLSSDGTGSTCETGNCIDNTCCGSKECGLCQSCSSGSCANIPAGQKDIDSCNEDLKACDGKGNCDWEAGHTCNSADECALGFCEKGNCCTTDCKTADSCSNSVYTYYTCESGKCEPKTQNCQYGCEGTHCKGSCASNSDCGTNQYCAVNGTCVNKIEKGKTCANTKSNGTSGSCATGICADGVCCDNACTGSCKSCNLSGKVGTCSTVTNAVDNTCSGTKQCDATGNCDLLNGQSCSSSTAACLSDNCVDGYCCSAATCNNSCTGNMLTTRSCSSGTCKDVSTAACSNNLKCKDGTSCYTGKCTSDSQCASGYYCNSGTCTVKIDQGNKCSTGNQCASGYCVDGHCCDKSACGTCQTCQSGSCVNVVDGQNDSDTCNGSTQQCKSGSCVKKQGQSCSAASDCYTPYCTNSHCCTTSSCSAADCSDETHRRTYSCGSSGICAANTPTACGTGYKCISGSCQTSCSSDTQCASGYYCNGNKCEAKMALASRCTKASACSSGFCSDDGYCCDKNCALNQTCTSGDVYIFSCQTGSCKTTQKQDCGNYICASNNCKTSCSSSSDCADGYYCNKSGACVAKLANGSQCSTGLLKVASEGPGKVCQNSRCSGDGFCYTGNADCPQYKCNSTTSETYSGKTGSCVKTETKACNAYICNTSTGTCNSSCSSDSQCSSDYSCSSSVCKKKQGKSCSNGTECATGNCVDGTCCSTSSCGTCQTCSTGTCSAIISGIDSDNCHDQVGCYFVTNNQHVTSGVDCTCSAGTCKIATGATCGPEENATYCVSGYCYSGKCQAKKQDTCSEKIFCSGQYMNEIYKYTADGNGGCADKKLQTCPSNQNCKPISPYDGSTCHY